MGMASSGEIKSGPVGIKAEIEIEIFSVGATPRVLTLRAWIFAGWRKT